MIKKSIYILLLSIFLLAACQPAPAEPVDEPSPAEIEVTMPGRVFDPVEVTIEVGTTVRWINTDNEFHTVTAGTRDNPTGLFDAPLDPGEEFSYTFDEPGTYEYHCIPHFGMDGVVIVE